MAGGPLCTRPPLLRPLRSDLGVGVEHPELAEGRPSGHRSQTLTLMRRAVQDRALQGRPVRVYVRRRTESGEKNKDTWRNNRQRITIAPFLA
jgi:hypothetical protein